MTTAVNNTTAAKPIDASSVGRQRLAENFDTFLTLLTAQMKNQDPLSPMDSTQFTQQLVQMTGVEQQLETNDLLKALVANTGEGIAGAVSLIGKEVRAESAEAGLANKKAQWIYNLPRNASEVKLEILDANGRIVRSLAGVTQAGDNTFTWDGKDQTGLASAPGVYTLRIRAKDGSGAAMTAKTYIEGVVNSVENTGTGDTLAAINGAKVSWNKVTHIRQPAPPADTAKTETNNPTDSSTSSNPAA